MFEGYGPNVEAIRALAETRRDAAGHRRLRHHQHRAARRSAEARPRRRRRSIIIRPTRRCRRRDALVNPNRLDDLSGLGHLAAVGLVFMTVVAVNRELRRRGFWNELRPEPDLLELARSRGARHRRRRGAAEGPQPRLRRQGPDRDAPPRARRPHRADGRGAADRPAGAAGISASCSARASMPAAASAAPISARGCCWRTIRSKPARSPPNSTGSTASGRRSSRRRWREAEAEAMAALGIEEKGAVVVTAGQGWHPGVVGLVAARLKERFGRPAFAIALEPGGIGTGSGRSIPGVDLGRAVRRAVTDGLLIKGGGHAMAAGVTHRAGRARAVPRLSGGDAARRRSRRRGARTALLIDGAVTAAGATVALLTTSRGPARSAPAIRSRCSRCRRTRSPMPRRSGRRMCARGCARATARCSTPSRSARPASRSARR